MVKRGDWTPWGACDYVEPINGDVVFCGTANHGGAWVPDVRANEMPVNLRTIGLRGVGGWWFEEDCAIEAVVAVFHCRGEDRAVALRGVQRQYPAHALPHQTCGVTTTSGYHRCPERAQVVRS